MSQFELWDHLANVKLKDHLDLDCYLGEFKVGHLCLLEMGLTYSEYDMVHSIIRGLPHCSPLGQWWLCQHSGLWDFIPPGVLKDHDIFWTYEATQARLMKTANQGILQTKASGDCLIRLIGSTTTTVKLQDCLHAPSACVNLLSVGRMTAARSKLGCSMDDGKFDIVQKNPDGSRVKM